VILTQDLADFRRRLAARHELGKSFLTGCHALFSLTARIRVGDSYHAPIRICLVLWSLGLSRLSRQTLLTKASGFGDHIAMPFLFIGDTSRMGAC
jgi:hypothetical protein